MIQLLIILSENFVENYKQSLQQSNEQVFIKAILIMPPIEGYEKIK
jgi:hypothetical protein